MAVIDKYHISYLERVMLMCHIKLLYNYNLDITNKDQSEEGNVYHESF